MFKQGRRISPHEQFFKELRSFAIQVTDKFSSLAAGEPEDQLRSPVDQLFSKYGSIISQKIILKGQSNPTAAGQLNSFSAEERNGKCIIT